MAITALVFESPKRFWTRFRSGVVGVVSTLVDLLALWALVEGFGVDPVHANVPALAAGLAVQFFGNKYFAFRDHSRAFVRQGSLFALVEVGALALNALAFHLLVTLTPLPWTASRLVGSGVVYFAYSFPLWSRIFADRSKSSC